MKIKDLLEQVDPNDAYDIISVEKDDDWGRGVSLQGQMSIPFYKLEQLFGMPTKHTDSDINYEWVLKIKYRDRLHPHYGTEDHDLATDTATIVVWDREPTGTPVHSINKWHINAKDKKGLWVFDEVLHKNIKIS